MTGAPSQPIHHHPDDQELDVPNDLPPPSYEAARAAGAAPPPRPGQLPSTATTIANPQTQAAAHDPAAASSSTPPYASSSPQSATQGAEQSTAAWGVTGDNAIALQPLAQPAMSTNGHQQTTPNATGRPNNGVPKVVPLHLMEEKSEWVDCQFCKKRAQTRIVKKGKGFQCLTGAAFCVVCVCLTPLPCCLHWFEQTQWFCTSCEKQIAVRVRDGEIRVFPTPEESLVPSQYATAPDVQQNPAVSGGDVQQQQQQQVGTAPGPVMAPSPPQHQSPTLAPPEHSPVSTPPPQAQYDPIPSPPALEQRPATPRIQVENTQPIPASQEPEPSSQLPDGPRQPLAGAHAEQGRQLAAVVSEGDRPPGAPPLKF